MGVKIRSWGLNFGFSAGKIRVFGDFGYGKVILAKNGKNEVNLEEEGFETS